MPHYEVVRVQSRQDRKQFMSCLWDLYRHDPHWIPPLIVDQEERLGFRPHPFYERNKIENFLAKKDGKVVGRIAAIVNYGHIERYQEQRGFFGFFESIDDTEVARQLFRAAGKYLQSEGMESIRGPVNPSLNHDIGCLVDGFQSPPTFMMTYNPPFYDRLIQESGFIKSQDVYAFEADTSMLDSLDPKMQFVIEEVQRRFNVNVRPLNTKRFDEEVKLFLDIYNLALQGTWGFVPMSDSELKHLAKGLKMLIEEDLTSVIEVDGKAVGVGFGLLDFNPRIKKMNGRLFPFGFRHLLLGRKRINRCRLISNYVLPEWQRWGLGLVILNRMLPDCLKRGIKYAEFSWVLESNQLSRGSLERGGAKRSKTYRIYDRPLSDF